MTKNQENITKPKIDTNKYFKNIEKAIQKLKQQEEKLIELYLSSSLDVETINRKDEFLNDLMPSLREDYKGFEYKQIKDMETLLTLYENYNSISVEDYLNNANNVQEDHKEIINNLVANQGVLVGAIILDNKFIGEVLFIPKMP